MREIMDDLWIHSSNLDASVAVLEEASAGPQRCSRAFLLQQIHRIFDVFPTNCLARFSAMTTTRGRHIVSIRPRG
jgi:hypothetical protein